MNDSKKQSLPRHTLDLVTSTIESRRVDTAAFLATDFLNWRNIMHLIPNKAVAVLSVVGFVLTSCRDKPTPADSPGPVTSAVVVSKEDEQRIVKLCSLCHPMPHPETFPKDQWPKEVVQGFDFYHKSGRSDVQVPSVEVTIEYFQSRAPAAFKFEAGTPVTVLLPSRQFRLDNSRWPQFAIRAKSPAISCIKSLQVDADDHPTLLLSDMAEGGVHLWRPLADGESLSTLAKIGNPAGTCVCDLDGNGVKDLVVGDLGSFQPQDHRQGRVVWLRDALASSTKVSQMILAEGLGRVADVQSADFDGDGDEDLVVAEFGWRTTGRVLWLQNNGSTESPKFDVRVLDPRHGAIHVPIVDLNRDGLPDFVVLLSQEHESIDVFLNRGAGEFEKQNLFAAGDPSFGSSGIQIVDLDEDGDEDVLFTNGDMFDGEVLKPNYGVHWLENRGTYPFEKHELTKLTGALRALAADIDNDGDLDIVACANWPNRLRDIGYRQGFDSVIWLQQMDPGRFQRHAIETGICNHATMELSDLDRDGDLDIIAGSFYERGNITLPAATIWWNEPR